MVDVTATELKTGFTESEAKQKDLFISLVDSREEQCKKYPLYLSTTTSFPINERPSTPELHVASIQLQLWLNQSKETKLPSEGWVYLFINGRLWREINIQGVKQYADVNLAELKGQPEGKRPATCMPQDHITVPLQHNGNRFTLQAAYSKVQWSWSYIELMGGLDSKEGRTENTIENSLRDMRCTILDNFDEYVNDPDPFKASQRTIVEVETPTATTQELLFSLPSWLDMAADIQAEHDAAIGAIESLIQVQTQDTGYYSKEHVDKVRIAMLLNQNYLYGNQKSNAKTIIQAIKDANYDRTNSDASADKLALAHQCLDLKAIESTLQTQRFEEIIEEAMDAKHQIIALLSEPRFISMLTDYTHLGTNEFSANRINGLLALGEVFEGFTIDPMQQAEPFLVNYFKYEKAEYWHLRKNPIPDFLDKLTGLGDEPHPLYDVTFNFEQIYPILWQEFQSNLKVYQRTPIEEMSFPERYNPNIKGLGDQLEDIHGEQIASQIIKQLLKLMAGFVAVDESKLDSWAADSASKDIKSKLVDTDGYDEVIQKRKKEIESLEKKRLKLEEQLEPLSKTASESSEKIHIQKEALNKRKSDLEKLKSEFKNKKPTEKDLENLKSLKVTIATQEHSIVALKSEVKIHQNLIDQKQLSIAEINTIIRTKKQYQTQRQASQNKPVYSQRATGQLTEGISTKNHLFMGEASQFISGKRIAKVKLDLQDIIDGNFPAHLSPLNKPAIKALQQRLKSGFQQLHTQGGKINNVNALGISFPVSSNALNGDRSNIDLALNQVAAAILDTKNKVPASTVDMYCLKADIDITLSEKDWSILQRKSQSDALYQDYLKLNKEFEVSKSNLKKRQQVLAQQKETLELISTQRVKTIDRASSYQKKNYQLMLKDQRIHSFQVKFQGGVAAFEVYNMALKWRALKENPSNKAWIDASLATIEFAGSLVDAFESSLRSLSPTSMSNYHEQSKLIRKSLKWAGRGLGIAGGFIAIYFGYHNVITAKALNDNARLWAGVTEIASGAMSIISISLITIGGLTKVALLATLGLYIGLAALALGLASLIIIFISEFDNLIDRFLEIQRVRAHNSAELTMLKKSTFGFEHKGCTEEEGLEDWIIPANCYAGLLSFLSQPTIKIEADDNTSLVNISIYHSALVQNHNTYSEVYIRGDENIFSNYGVPWQSLYTQSVIDQATQSERNEQTALPSHSKTYGVDYKSLARNISVNLQSGLKTLSIPIALFQKMSEESRCDDFFFRVLVRGIPKDSSETSSGFNLPQKFSNLPQFNSDSEVSRVNLEHFFRKSNKTWWYLFEKQLDLI